VTWPPAYETQIASFSPTVSALTVRVRTLAGEMIVLRDIQRYLKLMARLSASQTVLESHVNQQQNAVKDACALTVDVFLLVMPSFASMVHVSVAVILNLTQLIQIALKDHTPRIKHAACLLTRMAIYADVVLLVRTVVSAFLQRTVLSTKTIKSVVLVAVILLTLVVAATTKSLRMKMA
jgi:hypothetical protein